MAVAARSFVRRPREEQGKPVPGASLGAVLELLRALNWSIRSDVTWPTRVDRVFDFVLVGEPGVFAVWSSDEPEVGVAGAAAGLSELLGGIPVQAVVCRTSSSLTHADPNVMFCTAETALDLFMSLPASEQAASMRSVALTMRDLVVPPPPEPVVVVVEPEPEPEPVVPPAPEPLAAVAAAEPAPAVPAAVEPDLVEPDLVEEAIRESDYDLDLDPRLEPEPEPLDEHEPEVDLAPEPAPAPEPEPELEPEPQPEPELLPVPKPPLPAGRHRSEKPRRAPTRRAAPPPPPSPVIDDEPSTLELPSALQAIPERRKGGANPADRFDNSYVLPPTPAVKQRAVRREFRPVRFLVGVVMILAIAGGGVAGVKYWPQLVGLVGSHANQSAAFGATIRQDASNFHPTVTLQASVPTKVGSTYSVTITAVNVGTQEWTVPVSANFVMVDSLGESHPVVGGSRIPGGLGVSQTWSGRLLFAVPAGRTPLRLTVKLATDGSESATWKTQAPVS